MLLLEELRYFFTKFKTIQSHLSVFDSLVVEQAGIMHSLNQVDSNSFGLFFKELLGLESVLPPVFDVLAAKYLASAFDSSEFGQKLLSFLLDLHQIRIRISTPTGNPLTALLLIFFLLPLIRVSLDLDDVFIQASIDCCPSQALRRHSTSLLIVILDVGVHLSSDRFSHAKVLVGFFGEDGLIFAAIHICE